jgi:outer membrane protein TolC
MAQINLELAELNYSNSDTLFKIAQGRFNIGTIAENELLQMELSYLNAGIELNKSRVNLEMRKYRLRSFLGYNENVDITLVVPTKVPDLEIEVSKALAEAKSNNPEILNMERQIIEANSNVAQARAMKGLNADIYASYGLTQRAEEVVQAYADPLDQQGLQIGIQLPLVDWGLGRGIYKMAQSSMEVVRTNVHQAQIDFEQEVFLVTMQFNLQDDQVLAAAKADTIANSRYDVTKARFLIGKIDVLDLNVAQSEKDQARRGYVASLREYWNYFYTIRQYTLYDFIENEKLTQDFDF